MGDEEKVVPLSDVELEAAVRLTEIVGRYTQNSDELVAAFTAASAAVRAERQGV